MKIFYRKNQFDRLEPNPFTIFPAIGVAMILLIVTVIEFPLKIVGAGERGIVLNFGAVSEEVLDEGLHFKMPFVQTIKLVDVQVNKVEVAASSASKDLQSITTEIALNYHLDPTQVNRLYQRIGTEYQSRIISPAIQESVKAATSRYTAEELITKRDQVKADTYEILKNRLQGSYIIVDDFSITNFSFSKEFDAAIEAKQTAQQKALQAKNDLERIKTEAEQKVAAARAEAERIRIQAESISSQGGKEYVQLKAVEKWDGKLPVQMIPGSTVPFVNLDK